MEENGKDDADNSLGDALNEFFIVEVHLVENHVDSVDQKLALEVHNFILGLVLNLKGTVNG